jgi:3-oxoacyl-[acyl-carrier protein] reductase
MASRSTRWRSTTSWRRIRRQLSVELGPHGIRFVTLASGGVPKTFPADFEEAEQITKMIEDQTLLGRAATLEDVGKTAVFAASDWARSMTAAIVNVSCGRCSTRAPGRSWPNAASRR